MWAVGKEKERLMVGNEKVVLRGIGEHYSSAGARVSALAMPKIGMRKQVSVQQRHRRWAPAQKAVGPAVVMSTVG